MSDDHEQRLRDVERETTRRGAWWEEQRRLNSSLTKKLIVIFTKLERVPTEHEMTRLEEKVDTATKRQDTIIQLLDRKKGREDVMKIGLTFILTVASAVLVWALTK